MGLFNRRGAESAEGRRGLGVVFGALVLLVMFGLAVHSMMLKSPTFDEQGFLVRGLGYVRGENRWMRVGHPAGLGILNAGLLWLDDEVRLPVDDASWQGTSFHRPAELFMWEIGNDVERVMFLGRLPSVWLGMVMACVVARFARDVARRSRAGWMALVVVAFDPNVLAHTRLVTTDLGLVAGAVLAGYGLWGFLVRGGKGEPQRRRGGRGFLVGGQPLRRGGRRGGTQSFFWVVFAGVGFAVLQNTKFTAGLFLPIFGVVVFVGVMEAWRRTACFPWRMVLLLVTVYPLAAFLALWGMYGFEVGMLPTSLPTFEAILGGRTAPLSHHIEQLSDLGGRMQVGTPAFLLGDYSDGGWWYYFPVALVLKTPLPTLVLAGMAVVRLWSMRRDFAWVTVAVLVVPTVGFVLFGMTNGINIGYRHVLMVVPFLAIWIGVGLGKSLPQRRGGARRFRILCFVLLGWLVVETVVIAPDFLAYFNQVGGGAAGGWRSLVDSNIDWGQDLARLDDWMVANGVDQVRLSYFGEARPEYYGINYVGLPSFPPRLMAADAVTHYPADPAPGVYAISVTNLQGVLFDDRDQFAWFREREPIGHVGHSILLYEVAARGEGVDLALGGVQVTDLTAEEFAKLGTNDVRLRWFANGEAVVIPGGENGMLAWRGEDGVYFESAVEQQRALDLLPEVARFTKDEGAVVLRDFAVRPGEAETVWEQVGVPADIKIFVHVIDEQGEIVAQWDGLRAVWHGWRPGDRLLLDHAVAPVVAGRYAVWVGVYDVKTGVRWQIEGSDRYYLGEMVVQ